MPLPFLLLLLLLPHLHALNLPPSTRLTSRNDIIGLYTLHPFTSLAATPQDCPQNITTNTFSFSVTRSPTTLPHPSSFNIAIRHVNTKLSSNPCQSSGTTVVTTSSHPFSVPHADTITAWASAARRSKRIPKWISHEFLDAVSRLPFAVGFDFSQRACLATTLRPGVAFLWFQPAWNLPVGRLQVSGQKKYLILTFSNDASAGCVYEARATGGDGEFPPGPISDESLLDFDPEDIPEEVVDDDLVLLSPSVSPQPDIGQLIAEGDDDDEEEEEEEEEEDDDDNIFAVATDDDAPPNSIFGAGVLDDVNSSDEDDDDESACFPETARVRMADGKYVNMRDLNIGHRVHVAHDKYSDVFMFSHRERVLKKKFVRVLLEDGGDVTASAGHYAYVNGEGLRTFGDVKSGDWLENGWGERRYISSVSNVYRVGLFAPHTLHGDLVVDDVRVSSYTSHVEPRLAHLLLSPVRALYRVGIRVGGSVGAIMDRGGDGFGSFLPKGAVHVKWSV